MRPAGGGVVRAPPRRIIEAQFRCGPLLGGQMGGAMSVLFFAAWGLAALLEILGPAALAVWFARRYRVGVQPFLFGAAVFIVFQMLTRVPLVQAVAPLIGPRLLGNVPLQVTYLLVLASTAGLVESVGRWLGYRYLFRDRLPYDWENGVAYGLGHGGIESAALVGLSQLDLLGHRAADDGRGAGQAVGAAARRGDLAAGHPPQQIARTPWYLTLVGAYERAMTIPFHVAMSLVVLRCFTRGERRWLWVAVGLHALVDFTAPGMLSLLGWPVWVVEGYLTLWAAGAVWYIARAARPLRAQEAPAAG